MAKRTGLTTLRYLMYRACRLIVRWRPIISATYPDNTALQVALDATGEACELLIAEIDGVLEPGV